MSGASGSGGRVVSAPRGTAGLLVLVFLAGAGTMSVELAAVRLLAPWYGTSLAVWTNVIGVVLLALALGYLLGARLAASREPARALALALVVAGATVLALPALARPVAAAFLPPGQTLDGAAELLAWGSLATSLVLFLPPALALGCIGPLAVELVQGRTGVHPGTAGGRVLCASTLGSLLGTFGTTHVFLPRVGLGLTFGAAGALLLILGALLLVRRGRAGRGAAAGAVLLAAVAAWAPAPGTVELPAGTRLLEERESPYQRVRVVEAGEGALAWRLLQVNEGFDSFQSVWSPRPGLLGGGHYYDAFALPAWWDGAVGDWNVLVLGLGGGTVWRVLEGALPEGARLVSVGVELDPVVVELAQRWMDLPGSGPEREILSGWDARAALPWLRGSFDQIVLDVYANQMEIPAHLATRELFALLAERLRPGGWLVVNVGGFGLSDPVVEAVAATIAGVFGGECLALAVPFSRNAALVARRAGRVPGPGSAGWVAGEWPVAPLLERMAIPGAWRRFGAGDGPQLSDDRSGLEWLQRRSVERASRGTAP